MRVRRLPPQAAFGSRIDVAWILSPKPSMRETRRRKHPIPDS